MGINLPEEGGDPSREGLGSAVHGRGSRFLPAGRKGATTARQRTSAIDW
jgi:hypothetical protein